MYILTSLEVVLRWLSFFKITCWVPPPPILLPTPPQKKKNIGEGENLVDHSRFSSGVQVAFTTMIKATWTANEMEKEEWSTKKTHLG